jgi:diacylglycerol kinase (ATP)
MIPPKRTGIARLIAASGYSLAGVRAAFTSEAAVRQEFCAAAILVPVALFSGKSTVEIILLLSGVFVVIITELLNTAIEAAINRISLEHHALSKAAKDIASAAVMMSLIYCAMVWIGIFFF